MNTTTQLTLPPVGTRISIDVSLDVVLSNDGRTHMARITFDPVANAWVIASRLNKETMRWRPTTSSGRIGLMVFLNDDPHEDDRWLTVTAIQKSGRAVYADLEQ